MKQLTDNPKENTQSSNLTDSGIPRQRRVESPWVWVQFLGGSLVLHGALLAIALPLTVRLSAAQSGTPTPVEFVLLEPSPEPFSKPARQSPPEFAASSDLAPTQSQPLQTQQPTVSETAPPSAISFAPEPVPTISPSPLPSPEISPLPDSSPAPSPEVSPSPENWAESPIDTAAIPPQPNSLPLPVTPSVSPVQPLPEPLQPESQAVEPLPALPPEGLAPEPTVPETATPDSTFETSLETNSDRLLSSSSPLDTSLSTAADPSVLRPEILPSDPGLQTTPIDIPVPDVSEAIAAAPSTVDANDLNAASSEATPVGVTLNLSNSSRVAPRGDEPVETLEIARPLNSSTRFLFDPSASACQVTPEVLNWADTPIALQVTTDEQGKVLDVSVHQSSGSPDYDQLAVCLVREQWQFEPATVLNSGETQRQAIASDELLITLTINRS